MKIQIKYTSNTNKMQIKHVFTNNLFLIDGYINNNYYTTYYLLKKHKKKVIYLGQCVPVDNIVDVCEETKVTTLISAWVGACNDSTITNHFAKLQQTKKKLTQYVIGARISKSDAKENVTTVKDVKSLIKLLNLN